LRTRLHPFGLVSRSRDLLACTSSSFWTGFAFARTSCVHLFTLLDWFRVRESFLRTRLHPFGLVSRSREFLACTYSPFWTGFAFARASCVRVSPFWAGFAFARSSCVHFFILLDWFRVREIFLRTPIHPFLYVSCTRGPTYLLLPNPNQYQIRLQFNILIKCIQLMKCPAAESPHLSLDKDIVGNHFDLFFS
jgi:hypothetical protein